jgi:sodium/potassium/calcium exchanger 6
MNFCTNQLIIASQNECYFVKQHCQDDWQYIPFLNLYYCNLDDDFILFALISFIFIIVGFHLMKMASDNYVAPTLETMTQKLQISESLAGVTLLAFANGCNDVISGFVAGGKPIKEGLGVAIGGLFGACLFTCTIVLARCISGAGIIQTNKRNLIRDAGFILIATVYFAILAFIGKITSPLAAGFLIIYAIYIGIVLYQEKNEDSEGYEKVLNDIENEHLDSIASDRRTTEENEEKTWYQKALGMYDDVVTFVMDLTMPPFEEEKWNYIKALPTPLFGTLFFAWQTGLISDFGSSWIFWTTIALTITILTVLIYKERQENVAQSNGGILALIVFVNGCLWVYFVATLFMDFLNTVAIISRLPINYLALTILAWGNSLNDFFVDYSIAKSGHGEMAVAGVYGGQLFNVLVGFGAFMLRETVNNHSFKIGIFENLSVRSNLVSVILLGSVFFALSSTMVLGYLKGWALGRGVKYYMIIFYVVFLILVSILSLW